MRTTIEYNKAKGSDLKLDRIQIHGENRKTALVRGFHYNFAAEQTAEIVGIMEETPSEFIDSFLV